MKTKQETFANLMESCRHKFDMSAIFDDFLTMSLCAFSQNPAAKKSHDEDLYLQTIGKYKDNECQKVFPKLLGTLIMEMEERVINDTCSDVLGEYYESHLAKKRSSQFFTPWPICMFMAASITGSDHKDKDMPLRVLDPACGSGRMLLAGAKCMGTGQHYYGIDIDHTCVKMAAINLFLNGIFHAEVMCGDALNPNDFRISYVTSFLPFGVFRITKKEKSPLWHLMQHSLKKEKPETAKLILPSEANETMFSSGASQLNLF